MSNHTIQSITIDMLRLPLAIMVIFIHLSPDVVCILDYQYPIFTGAGVLNFIEILCSKVISHIAVPTFFFISGLLFFLDFRVWSWPKYKAKIGNRLKTILLPYFLWNLVSFLLVALAILFSDIRYGGGNFINFLKRNSFHIFYDIYSWDAGKNWLGEPQILTAPFDVPLWFLRDLFIVSLSTPILYYCIKKGKIFFICILFIAYISRILPQIPGLNLDAFMFFCLGAFFSLNNRNVLDFGNRFRCIILPGSVVLCTLSTLFWGREAFVYCCFQSIFCVGGIFALFIVASRFVVVLKIKPKVFLVRSCFFIYALHAAPIPCIGSVLHFSKTFLHGILGDSIYSNCFCFFGIPILTAVVCISFFNASNWICPRATMLFSGIRK